MPFSQSTTTEGLSVTTVNIPTADVYNFQGTLTLPPNYGSVTYGAGGGAGTGTGAAPQAPSQVVTTIRQNGTIRYTSTAGDKGFQLNGLVCAAADVITVTLTSSAATDQQPESVRLTLATSQGPL